MHLHLPLCLIFVRSVPIPSTSQNICPSHRELLLAPRRPIPLVARAAPNRTLLAQPLVAVLQLPANTSCHPIGTLFTFMLQRDHLDATIPVAFAGPVVV